MRRPRKQREKNTSHIAGLVVVCFFLQYVHPYTGKPTSTTRVPCGLTGTARDVRVAQNITDSCNPHRTKHHLREKNAELGCLEHPHGTPSSTCPRGHRKHAQRTNPQGLRNEPVLQQGPPASYFGEAKSRANPVVIGNPIVVRRAAVPRHARERSLLSPDPHVREG